jgi:archaellum component FlaC
MAGKRNKRFLRSGQQPPSSGITVEEETSPIIVHERELVPGGWGIAEYAFATIVLVVAAATLIAIIAFGVTNQNEIEKLRDDVKDIQMLPEDVVQALQPVLNDQTQDINDFTQEIGQQVVANVTANTTAEFNSKISIMNDTINDIDTTTTETLKRVKEIQTEQQQQAKQLDRIEQELNTTKSTPVPVSRQQCSLASPIVFSGHNQEVQLASANLTETFDGIENGIFYNSRTGEFKFGNVGPGGNKTTTASVEVNLLVSDIDKTTTYVLGMSDDSTVYGGFRGISRSYQSDDDEGGCKTASTAHPYGCHLLWLNLKTEIKVRAGDSLYFFVSATKLDDDDDDDGLGMISNEYDYAATACSRASFIIQTVAPLFDFGDSVYDDDE